MLGFRPRGQRVAPRSTIEIREMAEVVRRLLNIEEHETYVDLLRIAERTLYECGLVFKVGEIADMGTDEGSAGVKSLRQREAIRRRIITGESRIVVCVDMLGEGFDLPELKITAFHDIRKTLAVTLQLAGRFTRVRPDLGNATFVANTAGVNVQDELRKLYSRDPDWNVLLPQLSDKMIGEQLSLQDFLRGFTEFTKEIPLKTVRPATSTVAYRTTCDAWTPENFRAGIPGLNTCEQVHETVNHAEHTLVIVTVRRCRWPGPMSRACSAGSGSFMS